MNAAMVQIFLRSAKVPKPVTELVSKLMDEGFGAVQFAKAKDDDPMWARINPIEGYKRMGLQFRAQSPNSRVTGIIFLEGIDDELLSQIGAFTDTVARKPLHGANDR